MFDSFRLVAPLLRVVDPETGHRLAIQALKNGLVPRPEPFEDPVLRISLWGLDFANPVGPAAGFDKNAEAVDGTLAQGFGFTEVGSVTPKPQAGNPRPRLFRLPEDGAVINRLGFNNDGVETVVRRLERRRGRPGIVGVNLGKNRSSEDAVADYVIGIKAAARLADFLVVNVSSPNTPGLRALQSRDHLGGLLDAALAARAEAAPDDPPPLLLKIAPDLTDEDKRDIAAVSLAAPIDGLIATNTTIERPAELASRHAAEAGGLSGRPLFALSTRVLSEMYRLTRGKVPLIGVGGIASGADAYAKVRAGASLVEVYTALIYQGPGQIDRIKRELAALVRADGFSNIAEAVGADHR